MKVLMIAPHHGGINIYVKLLCDELKRNMIECDHIGSQLSDFPYNVQNKSWRSSNWAKNKVLELFKDIDFNSYDIIALHYGKNDIEQYLPVLLNKNKATYKTKFVYFAHYLSRNLFSKYLIDSETAFQIEELTNTFFDGYVFFGTFAKNHMNIQSSIAQIVSYLPETHSHEILSKSDEYKYKKEFNYIEGKTVYWPGYTSNYKNPEIFLRALENVKEELNVIFAGRGWEKRLGFKKKNISNSKINIIDREINSNEFKFLVEHSLFGIFPYQQPLDKDEIFQGSGVLPNYIYSGKATIVFNEGCLAEYVGDSGIVVEKTDISSFAQAIGKLCNNKDRAQYEEKSKNRSNLFSIATHSTQIKKFFTQLI